VTSKARQAFDKNCGDISRLLEIHVDLGGDKPGRRRRLEVLNKSAVVLLCAFWEAYCEDIAAEGLAHMVEHARNVDSLPNELRKAVAIELKSDKNELAIWDLSGDGWRQVLLNRLERLQAERNRRLNTPKADRIDELFLTALGIPKMSGYWRWKRLSVARSRQKLDDFVSLRGEIAHRGKAAQSVRKTYVEDALEHVRRLVSRTGQRVNIVATGATGKKLW
jgi:RiboL-PSP-HEPN